MSISKLGSLDKQSEGCDGDVKAHLQIVCADFCLFIYSLAEYLYHKSYLLILLHTRI